MENIIMEQFEVIKDEDLEVIDANGLTSTIGGIAGGYIGTSLGGPIGGIIGGAGGKIVGSIVGQIFEPVEVH